MDTQNVHGLTHMRVYTTNDTPRGYQYHTTTIVSPGARGRGRPGGTQQSKGIYSGYFCLLPLLLKLVNLDLDLDLVRVFNLVGVCFMRALDLLFIVLSSLGRFRWP